MKALYAAHSVAPYRVGGMQSVARRQATGLAAAGWDVVLVHGSPLDGQAVVRLPPGLREVHVASHTSRWRLLRGPGHYAALLRRFSRDVQALVERERPDVVYAEGPVVSATLAHPRPHRPPVLFHPHGLGPFQDQGRCLDNLRGRWLRPLFRWHAQRAEAVVSQGGLLTDLLERRLGVERRRIVHLPNAVPPESCLEVALGEERSPRLLFVGRPEPAKGLRHLLAALTEVAGATLDIVGSSAPAGSSADSRVRWHGEVRDRAALLALYDQAKALVLPSRSEGMPTVVLEAMARGVPVVATRVGAVPDLVKNGSTGWLVEPGDRRALVEALRDVVALSPQAWEARSRAALRLVRDGYLQGPAMARLERILGDLAGSSGSVAQAAAGPTGAALGPTAGRG
jgi:glycosyltransferase involved in cell wall biosynthesis